MNMQDIIRGSSFLDCSELAPAVSFACLPWNCTAHRVISELNDLETKHKPIGQRNEYVASSPQWLDAPYLHFPVRITKSPFNLLFTTTRFAIGDWISLWVFTEGKSIPHALMMYDVCCSVNVTLTAQLRVHHIGYWAPPFSPSARYSAHALWSQVQF